MKEDGAVADALFDLDQPELHPRSKLRQPDSPLRSLAVPSSHKVLRQLHDPSAPRKPVFPFRQVDVHVGIGLRVRGDEARTGVEDVVGHVVGFRHVGHLFAFALRTRRRGDRTCSGSVVGPFDDLPDCLGDSDRPDRDEVVSELDGPRHRVVGE